MENAYYFAEKLSEIKDFKVVNKDNFFNEVLVKYDGKMDFESFDKKLKDNGMVLGLKLGKYFPEFENHWLVCATEMTSKEEIDLVVGKIKGLI